MSSAVLQQSVVDELRLCAGGAAPTLRELRLAVDCSAAELAGAVQALRYGGKLKWDALELSPSMIDQDTVSSPQREETPRSVGCDEGAAGGAKPIPDEGGPTAAGPDDEDDDERPSVPPYPGEVNDEAEQGPQGDGPVPAESPPGDGADALRADEPALPVGRVEEPRSGPAGGQRSCAPRAAAAGAGGPAAVPPLGRPLPAIAHERAVDGSGSFVPPKLLHQAGVHAANTRAAARPLPAPEHEPEIARLVREECNETAARRNRARSTGTVRQPLELRKFGVPDMTLAESVTSMLAEEPHDLIAAVNRKHPKLWRRILLLGRSLQLRPAEALYAVIERGLGELEQAETETVE